jgi:ribonucleotide monophosphatase NagD (HAD superfamily)
VACCCIASSTILVSVIIMGFSLESIRPAATLAFATTTTAGTCSRARALLSASTPRASLPRGFTTTVLKKSWTATSSSSALSLSALSSSSSYSTHPSFNDDIIDRYDAFILDQFGVLHNGVNALDGAVELIEYLYKTKHKKLMILSNTSAPADKALAKLPKFGFDSSHFVGAVTSGEVSSQFIRETYGGGSTKTKKALMFTWDVSKPNNPRLTALPEVYLGQCGSVEVATSVEDADFVLFHGSEVWYRGPNHEALSLSPFIEQGSFDNLDPILYECSQRKLPAICANPDFVVQTPTGDGIAYMPGKIAQRYETKFGGVCQTFGKPAVEHFEACLQQLGFSHDDDKIRVAHVGDSLHHDIVGAVNAGIPNVFVTSGIHKNDLGTQFGELPSENTLEALLEKEMGSMIRPTHVVSAFRRLP